MKKQLFLLLTGMILIIIGALLKINGNAISQYLLIAGLAIEAVALTLIVVGSLKRMK